MDEINLFKNLPTPTSLMDKDGRRIDTNLATERLFGRSRDEIIGAKVEELYAKGDKEEIKNAFEESKRTGFSACEVTARGDGTTFPAILNFSSIKDEKGNVANVIVTATDASELKTKEEDLEKSQRYTTDLLTSMPEPLCVVNMDGIRVDSNPALENITGLSREELIGKPSNLVLVEGDRPKAKKLLKKTVEEGFVNNFELTMRSKEGKRIPVLADTAVRRDEDGKPIGVILNFSDITELKEKDRFITDVIKSIPDPLAVIGRDNRLINVNDGWKRVFGYEKEELLDREMAELPIISPERREGMEERVRKNVERLHRGEIIEVETFIRAKDGREVPILLSEALVPSIDGRTIVAKDITELKKKEEEMNKIIETSPAAMVLTDEEGRWIVFNKAAERIFGYSREEVLGKKTPEQNCTMPETIEALEKIWKSTIEERKEAVEGVEVPWRTKDGRIVIHNAYEVPFRKGEGRLYAAVDITDLRKMIDQIKDTVLVLNTAIKELNAAYNQISTASEDIAGAMNSTAQGAEDQATSLSNIINSMEDLTEQSKSFIRMSGEIEKSADLMRDVLEGSSSKAIEAGMSLDEIYRTLGENAKEIKDLSSEVSKVSKLTDFINSVADKTDTLGLVAGVVSDISGSGNEGEGKGLRSIAKRIDDLAKSSSNYARDAKGIIEGLSKRIDETIEESDRTIESVMDSKMRIKGALDSLNEINELTGSNIEKTIAITEIGTKQIEGMDNVKQMAGDAGSIATEYASQVEEVSASVEEQSASIEETKATIENLVGRMNELEKLTR